VLSTLLCSVYMALHEMQPFAIQELGVLQWGEQGKRLCDEVQDEARGGAPVTNCSSGKGKRNVL
jgi:hypothetical protein